MSLAIVYTRARLGIEAPKVTVEVHLSNGLPGLSIVGLPETAVKESKDRVRSAIINSQFEFPARRITINLAPADLPKDGSRFDLAIAIGILCASQQIPCEKLNDYEFIGELALSGELRGVTGILPAAICCGEQKRALVIANENEAEANLSEQTQIYKAASLLEVCQHLTNEKTLDEVLFNPPRTSLEVPDFSDVKGQQLAKRALEIAAAGGHNILLYGPPGTGKTMLASRLPGIMPPLEQSQAIEVASIHSLCALPYPHWQTPPFRSPHHTASAIALVGGGGYPKPGEISLAHHGVLFLDELPEFQRKVLEVLREPMESGQISISRAKSQITFPARFQLIAAMNPCPCGYLSHQQNDSQTCSCTLEQVRRYRQKISGPLLDRIDLHIPVNKPKTSDLRLNINTSENTEPSAKIRQRVLAARQVQWQRQSCSNSQLSVKQIEDYCNLGQTEINFLEQALNRLQLSVRAYHRIIKVSRTIADLAGNLEIENEHIAEALSLRNFDR
jgi:magnesium chelatase family protein